MTCRILAPASGATGQDLVQQAFRLLKRLYSHAAVVRASDGRPVGVGLRLCDSHVNLHSKLPVSDGQRANLALQLRR